MKDPGDNNDSWGPANSFKAFRDAGPLLGLGIQMAAAIVIMFFIGRWLDGKWGTAPWMMLLGLMFGAAGGLYNFVHTVNQMEKKKEREEGSDDIVKIDWSFPKQVLLALLIVGACGAYPVIAFGGQGVPAAAITGAVLATVNVLVGYAAIEYSFGKSTTTFFKYVMGGMGVRVLFLAVALVVLIKFVRMHTLALMTSMGIFYIVFLTLEVLFIQKKIGIKQQ